MRFVHLSDSHLGYRQFGIFDREEDLYDMFEKTIDKIIELDVDFVIHSGDLFEQSRPSTNAMLAFQRGLLRLNDANIPVYAIAGNHDSVLRANVEPPIALFEELGLNIIRLGEAYEIEDAFICGVPYTPKSQKNGLLKILNYLSNTAEDYEKSILVMHQGIKESLPEDAYELELNELPKNFNYYAFGHIHDYYEIDYGKGKFVYPGSMEMYKNNANYEEYGKGFCVVDISSDVPVIERITIDIPRKQLKRTINYNNLNKELDELKDELEKLDLKPMLELTVKYGDFESSEVYEIILEVIGDYVLNLRPKYKPDEILEQEKNVNWDNILDPKTMLMKKIDEKYGMKEVTGLSVDLLDNLSAKNLDDAKYLSIEFYDEYYASEENNDLKED